MLSQGGNPLPLYVVDPPQLNLVKSSFTLSVLLTKFSQKIYHNLIFPDTSLVPQNGLPAVLKTPNCRNQLLLYRLCPIAKTNPQESRFEFLICPIIPPHNPLLPMVNATFLCNLHFCHYFSSYKSNWSLFHSNNPKLTLHSHYPELNYTLSPDSAPQGYTPPLAQTSHPTQYAQQSKYTHSECSTFRTPKTDTQLYKASTPLPTEKFNTLPTAITRTHTTYLLPNFNNAQYVQPTQ